MKPIATGQGKINPIILQKLCNHINQGEAWDENPEMHLKTWDDLKQYFAGYSAKDGLVDIIGMLQEI